MATKGSILLFDNECNLCYRLINFVIKHDNRGEIVCIPLQSERGRSMLLQCGFGENYSESAVYLRDKQYFVRSSAILNILKDLGGGWRLLYGFIIIPGPLRDLLYSMIARVRYWLFRKRFYCNASLNTGKV